MSYSDWTFTWEDSNIATYISGGTDLEFCAHSFLSPNDLSGGTAGTYLRRYAPASGPGGHGTTTLTRTGVTYTQGTEALRQELWVYASNNTLVSSGYGCGIGLFAKADTTNPQTSTGYCVALGKVDQHSNQSNPSADDDSGNDVVVRAWVGGGPICYQPGGDGSVQYDTTRGDVTEWVGIRMDVIPIDTSPHTDVVRIYTSTPGDVPGSETWVLEHEFTATAGSADGHVARATWSAGVFVRSGNFNGTGYFGMESYRALKQSGGPFSI